MKNLKIGLLVFSLCIGILLSTVQNFAQGPNAINGMIFDHNRRPVAELYIELLDGFERLIKTTKTKNSGLYFFRNLSQGIYYINIRIGGTAFKSQKLRIDLGSTNRTTTSPSGTTTTSGSDVQQKNFYLQLDPRNAGKLPSSTGVIFAQNVPDEAKTYYNQALKNGNKKPKEAIGNLEQAISIFPDYFAALTKLGELYLINKKYAEAENLLKRAAKVNPKSFSIFWSLAVAQNNLKKRNEAIASLLKANEIDSGSVNSFLLLGIIQRDVRQYKAAEKSLLKAKELGKGRVPEIHLKLALLYYYNLKQYNTAADELELYLKALPKKERKTQKAKIAQYKTLIKTFRKKANEVSKK